MSRVQVIDDIDKLMNETLVEDVMYVFSAYTPDELKEWIDSFVFCKDLDSHTKAVIDEVKALLLVHTM